MKKILLQASFIIAAYACRGQQIDNAVITGSTFTASSFISDSVGWLADNNGKLWHTTNAAVTWDSVSIQKNFTRLQFIDALNGYALSSTEALVHHITPVGYIQ